jgi:hypothetical protein
MSLRTVKASPSTERDRVWLAAYEVCVVQNTYALSPFLDAVNQQPCFIAACSYR